MKSFEQLAKAAYETFAKTVVRESGISTPRLCTWDELDPVSKAAWTEATRQTVAEYAVVH